MPKAVTAALIKAIHGGSFFFAYYPDQAWLAASPILQDCEAPKPTGPGPQLIRVKAKVLPVAKAKKG